MSGPLGRYFCHYQSGLQVLLSDRVEEGSNWKLSSFLKMKSRLTRITIACNMQYIASDFTDYPIIVRVSILKTPNAKYIVDALGMKTCQTAETSHSQSTQEPAFTTSSYSPGDETNGCAFLSMV